MKESPEITVLLVEDNDTDALLARDGLAADEQSSFAVTRVTSLTDAIDKARTSAFAVALLDLGLPDSQGIETFARLHEQIQGLPVVVLTGHAGEEIGTESLKRGAVDFLSKRDSSGAALGRAVRFALERFRVHQQREAMRQREAVSSEMTSLESLSEPPGTNVTATIYSGGSLRQRMPEQFEELVDRYQKVLDRALEQRSFKVKDTLNATLESLSDELGEWRAGPRDVIDIHTAALRACLRDSTASRAQAYLEEGRLIVIKLMGQLTTYYRQYYIASRSRRVAE